MADNSPEAWATANLDPVSRSPVHPTSPIIMPELQQQIDIQETASLNDPSPIVAQVGVTPPLGEGSPTTSPNDAISTPEADAMAQAPPKLPGGCQIVSGAILHTLPNNPPPTSRSHHPDINHTGHTSVGTRRSARISNKAARTGSSLSASIYDLPPPRVPLPPKPPTPAKPPMGYHLRSTSQFINTRETRTGSKQQWERFLQDEQEIIRKDNWDEFPDGSRLYIRKLVTELTSRMELFYMFSEYGHIAHISLKSGYGFVQYRTAAESQAAINGLQGARIHGRKIKLQMSRPPRRDEGQRASIKREDDNQDDDRRRREGYRPERQFYRQREMDGRRIHESSNQGRVKGDSDRRRRSMSPSPEDRNPHRQRSRQHSWGADQESHVRDINSHGQGVDIPDVRFLILQDVKPEFIAWVKGTFDQYGLAVDTRFPNLNLPRTEVIRQQVLDGVSAAAELDLRAQKRGKIQLIIFKKPTGDGMVPFDQYEDVGPAVAALLVARERLQTTGNVSRRVQDILAELAKKSQ